MEKKKNVEKIVLNLLGSCIKRYKSSDFSFMKTSLRDETEWTNYRIDLFPPGKIRMIDVQIRVTDNWNEIQISGAQSGTSTEVIETQQIGKLSGATVSAFLRAKTFQYFDKKLKDVDPA